MENLVSINNILLLFCCFSSLTTAISSLYYGKRIYKRFKKERPTPNKPSELALEMLSGKNGIEIGASTQNSFHLTNRQYCKNIGGYLNVDFTTEQRKWQTGNFEPAVVNVVSTGDKLPFISEAFDYVLSSHMIEHAFDPIATIKEWMRVIKKDGYIFMIVPHKDRTFDSNRDVTPIEELLDRHNGKIKINNYAKPDNQDAVNTYFQSIGSKKEGMIAKDIPSLLIKENETLPLNWTCYNSDDHHHWTVWNTESFLELCKQMQWRVVKYQDIDDKVGNGFTIVIQK
jgi:SAM-dependent methyltransferase